MRNNLSKYIKVLTSIACFSLISISNNSELAAKYLPKKEEEFNENKINPININQYANDPLSAYDLVKMGYMDLISPHSLL